MSAINRSLRRGLRTFSSGFKANVTSELNTSKNCICNGFRSTHIFNEISNSSRNYSDSCFLSKLENLIRSSSRTRSESIYSVHKLQKTFTPESVSFSVFQIRNLSSIPNQMPNSNFSRIGERARALQQKRLWKLALGGTITAGFVIIILNTFQENLMFYITPSEALEKFYKEPAKNRFRLGGLVLEGSVKHFANSTEMEFIVTDLISEILVRYRGNLPGLFREGHSVVVEGFLKPFTEEMIQTFEKVESGNVMDLERAKSVGCFFSAAEVLAKHDEKYMPKEVALALERNKAALEEEKLKETKDQKEEEAEVSILLSKDKSKGAAMESNQKQSKFSKVAQSPKQSKEFELA